ncbi:hypothetical protein ACVWWO_003283 [Bradyrhizobium sp. F1.13.1]
MADQRQLQSATEGVAVHRSDDRLPRIFHRSQQLVPPRRFRRLAELGDIRSGDESATGAGQNDRLHLRIGDRGVHGFQDAAANRSAQRVHGGIVDRDNGDRVMTFEFDYHATSLAVMFYLLHR